jgi:hypothetical protein
MWNEHLQEVIDKLVTTLQEMPLEKRTHVLTLVVKKLSTGQLHDPKSSLTLPRHKWILPQGDLQQAPCVPPREQTVPKQRVLEQRVMLEEGELANNMPLQLPTLARITNTPPHHVGIQPYNKAGTAIDEAHTFTADMQQHTW